MKLFLSLRKSHKSKILELASTLHEANDYTAYLQSLVL